MTTIVGLASSNGPKGVVLASDITVTVTDPANHGDVIVINKSKRLGRKIYTSRNNEFAVGMSGTYDDAYLLFLNKILEDPDIVRRAVDKRFFDELRTLNEARWGYKEPGSEINYLLVAARFDNQPKLYSCWPLGKVEEDVIQTIGSGYEYASKFIKEELSYHAVSKHSLTLKGCIHLGILSLDAASKDMHTGGLDFLVVTPDKIEFHGEEIREALRTTRDDQIKKIISAYGPNPE